MARPISIHTSSLYTHFEVPDARRVFATFEQPDLRAPVTFTVVAPSGWTVLSNSPTPQPERVSASASRWRFAPTPPISTYLTAVVAGDYHLVHDTYQACSGQVIPLALACRASAANHLDPAEIFEVTRQGFDYYQQVFDRPYPYAKYDQIFVDRYFAFLLIVWERRTAEMARRLASGLYPRLVIEDATVAATDAFLATADPPPPLRRILLEGRDDVLRALRARELGRAIGAI